MHRSRGAVLMDLNADGLQDLAVVNRRAPLELYQNVTPNAGNWLQIDLLQPDINRFAVGAFVEVRSDDRLWTQEVTIGGGHAGGTAGALHFGLDDLETVEVRVIWPDGSQSGWQTHPVNQRIAMERH